MCLGSLVEKEKQRQLMLSAAKNNFKRHFMDDWVSAFGKSGDTVNAFKLVTPVAANVENNFMYGPMHKLMFETLGMDYSSMLMTQLNSTVKYMIFGIKKGWGNPRGSTGFLSATPSVRGNGATQKSYESFVAKLNPNSPIDKDKFDYVVNEVGSALDSKFGMSSSYPIEVIHRTESKGVSSIYGKPSDAQKEQLLTDAKNNALASINYSFNKDTLIGVHSINGITMSDSSLENERWVTDPMVQLMKVDGVNIDSPTFVQSSNVIAHVSDAIYSSTLQDDYSYKTYCFVTVVIEYRMSLNHNAGYIVDPDRALNTIRSRWNTVTSKYNMTCHGKGCHNMPLPIYGYRHIFSSIIYARESYISFLVESGSNEFYNMSYSKFLRADVDEIIYMVESAINIWIIEEDGGFWDSAFGGFLKGVIFLVSAALITFINILSIGSGSYLYAALGALLSMGIAYGAGYLTQSYSMFQALSMLNLMENFAFALDDVAFEYAFIDFESEGYGALLGSMNNLVSVGYSMYASMRSYDIGIPNTHNNKYDTYGSDDANRDILYGNGCAGDMYYYNYDVEPAFSDRNFDYDTMLTS